MTRASRMTLSFNNSCNVSGWFDSTKYLLCLRTSFTFPYERVRSRMNSVILSGTGTFSTREMKTTTWIAFTDLRQSIQDLAEITGLAFKQMMNNVERTDFDYVFCLKSYRYGRVQRVRSELVFVDKGWSGNNNIDWYIHTKAHTKAHLLTGSLIATRKS